MLTNSFASLLEKIGFLVFMMKSQKRSLMNSVFIIIP